MRLIIHNAFTRIELAQNEELPAAVFDYMRLPYVTVVSKRGAGGRFYPSQEQKFFRLLRRRPLSMPTGMVFRFADYIEENCPDIVVEWDDRRAIHHHPVDLRLEFPHKLWEHQKEAIAAAVAAERGIIQIPTAGGKTAIAAFVIREIGRPTLFLVNGLSLLGQTVRNFREFFPDVDIGVIGGGEYSTGFITVASVQTLWSRRVQDDVQHLLKSVDVVIGDEIHHVAPTTARSKTKDKKSKAITCPGIGPIQRFPGNTMFYVLSMVDAKWRYGLSATPGAAGSIRRGVMRAVLGKLCYRTTYNHLRDLGILSDVYVFMVESPQFPHKRKWRTAYDTYIQKSDEMNTLVLRMARILSAMQLSALVVVNRLNFYQRTVEFDEQGQLSINERIKEGHARILLSLAHKMGMDISLLSGDLPDNDRLPIIDQLQNEPGTLCISTILREGIDIPNLGAIVYACGGRAATQDDSNISDSPAAIQTIGRILRKPHGKHKAVFVDFLHRDGGVLESHSCERKQAYEEHGYPVTVVSADAVERVLGDWYCGDG